MLTVDLARFKLKLEDTYTYNRQKYGNWNALAEAVEEWEDEESELASQMSLVNGLVEKHGPTLVQHLDALQKCFVDSEGLASTVVSTVHQAKGAEWQNVFMWSDFRPTRMHTDTRGRVSVGRGRGCAGDEDNLVYVAATRARQTLVINQSLGDLLDRVHSGLNASLSVHARTCLMRWRLEDTQPWCVGCNESIQPIASKSRFYLTPCQPEYTKFDCNGCGEEHMCCWCDECSSTNAPPELRTLMELLNRSSQSE